MNDVAFGFTVLTAMSLVCALVAHLLIRRSLVASLLSTAIVAGLFHLFARSRWEQSFLYAWATGAVIALIVALIVGWGIRRFRTRKTSP